MQKVLHARDDIDRFYVLKNRGRKLASIQGSVDTSIGHQDYTEKCGIKTLQPLKKNTNNEKNGKKNNRMDILRDKQATSNMRKLGQGRENGWLVYWVLWHINLCRLFNAKSIFM